MEEELIKVVNSQGSLEQEAFSKFPHTAQFWKTCGQPPQTLEYLHSGEPIKVPGFYFLDLSKERQLQIAKDLATATVRDTRELIYEVGFGSSLSPMDTAFAGKDRTVIGVDPNGQFYGRIRAGVENLKLPAPDSTSFATFFKLDVKDLVKDGSFPRAKWVQAFAPFENMVGEILNLGTSLSDQVYIVPNPMGLDTKILQDALATLPHNYSGSIKSLSRGQVEEILGTSISSFLAGIGPNNSLLFVEAHLNNSPSQAANK